MELGPLTKTLALVVSVLGEEEKKNRRHSSSIPFIDMK